ncbi:MAG: carboxyltransferase domain-containing protein, partial [Endomicrobium sp.]|nr:carboxyltransferase domain-containing protein [Endomicrobium sp.]
SEIAQISISPDYPLLVRKNTQPQFSVRCAGDRYLLIEYGKMVLDITLRFKAHHLMLALEKSDLPIIEMTPGVRSLQVHIDTRKISLTSALNKIVEIERALPEVKNIEVPSRIVKMPLSWNDPQIRLAVERYHKNVRPNAPWCPSNIEFIRRINGLKSVEEVKKIIFDASYLTLGLGDVYLGAPLTVSLDPRHRLVTTKYNPARTWTPENAVGIGGAYMGIYGMEGPGGYQLFGRTLQTWNHFKTKKDYPWTLKLFDQIKFYEVSSEELLKIRRDFLRGKYEIETQETTFNLGKYLDWLESIKESAGEFQEKQQKAFEAERQMWKDKGLDIFSSDLQSPQEISRDFVPKGMTAIRASMSGVVWKINFNAGETLAKGDAAVVLESMKMELSQAAHESGVVEKICVSQGQQVSAGQLLAIIKSA